MILSALNILVNVSPLAAVVLAQADGIPPSLMQYGPLGIICGWFMFRCEALIKEVRTYGHKIDGLRLALLAQAAASETANPHVRKLCEEEIVRIKMKGDSPA